MTVLFFTRRFYPQVGGVETHILKISEGLIKKGYEIIVVTEALQEGDGGYIEEKSTKWQTEYRTAKSTGKDELIANRSYSDVNNDTDEQGMDTNFKKTKINVLTSKIIVYRMPNVKEGRLKKIYIWKWLWSNRKIVQKADLIHCHDVFFWYLPFRFLYPRKPVYTTFHGYETYPIPWKNIIIRKISEKLSWGNICIGDFIRKWYGTKPTYVSYGGADPFPPSKFKNKRSAIFIGRLEENTGILIYLDAIRTIQKKYPEFTFTVIGEGNLLHELEGKVTKIVGWQPHEEAIKLIQKHNIVFASGYLSILEALAAGRIVFAAYDNPLKEDYLKMTPFVNWINIMNNKNNMVKEIDQCLNNDKKKDRFIDQSYKWVNSQTWNSVVDTYLKLWESPK
jgi:glycosyltransferase involved in cell wall biosynthesis